jgi:hypothetical protein
MGLYLLELRTSEKGSMGWGMGVEKIYQWSIQAPLVQQKKK